MNSNLTRAAVAVLWNDKALDTVLVKKAFYFPLHPLYLVVTAIVIWSFGHWYTRGPFDPLPIIGHMHIFLTRRRWGHFDYYLAASKYYWSGAATGASHSEYKQIDDEKAMVNNEASGRMGKGTLTWRLRIPGPGSVAFTSDPACIKHVLVTKAKQFEKTGLVAEMTQDFLGKGAFVVTGHGWRMQRQAGKLFALSSTLAQVHDTILPRCLGIMRRRLDTAAESGQAVDFSLWSKDLNLAIFGVLAYDAEPELLLDELAQPMDAAVLSVSHRFANPFWAITERFTAGGKQYSRDKATVKRVSREMVERVVKGAEKRAVEGIDVDEDGARIVTLVERLIRAGMEDHEEMADSCLNFTFAGRDTTSHAITWTIYRLLKHPEIMTELREYLASPAAQVQPQSDLTERSNTGIITASILPVLTARLQPLDDIVSESLRLHPPAPIEFTQNISSDPIALPSGDIIKPGEFVTWCPWVMNRLPDFLWGSQESADTFDPSRWAKMREKGERKTVFEMPTFHAGPRACLGKDMARVVLLMTLEVLVREYEFEMDGVEVDRKVGDGLTGSMDGGLDLRVRKRVQ